MTSCARYRRYMVHGAHKVFSNNPSPSLKPKQEIIFKKDNSFKYKRYINTSNVIKNDEIGSTSNGKEISVVTTPLYYANDSTSVIFKI